MAGKRKFETPEELEKLVDQYFIDCASKNRIIKGSRGQDIEKYQPMSVVGLCNFLNITKPTLAHYEARPEFKDILLLARQKIEQDIIDHAVNGDYNPVFSIFHLKNHFGWKDRNDADKTANDLLTGILEGAVEHYVKDIKDNIEKKSGKKVSYPTK